MNVGDGLKGVDGEVGALGAEGAALASEEVGDVCGGRDGSVGPPDIGEFCRSDGEGEPEDSVDDLKGLIALTGLPDRRIGRGPWAGMYS